MLKYSQFYRLETGTAMQPLRIAFVAFSRRTDLFRQDPSYIYRCENLAMALTELGHTCELFHFSQLKERLKAHFDIVVFHRPKLSHWHTYTFERQARALRKRGSRLVADFDDLIFDPDWAPASPGVINAQVSLAQTSKNFQRHQRALLKMDFVSVSTIPLLDKVQQLVPSAQCHFLPNHVHLRWRHAFRPEQAPSAVAKPMRPRLTYFPGTRSHDKDFATISEPLSDFLNDSPNVQLQITGHLNLGPGTANHFTCRPEQLLRFEKQNFDSYAQHVATSWVNLAPLQDTVFNQHKSALKAIEAAYFNAPTLATPIPDMQRLAGSASILVESNQDWYAALDKALESPPAIDHETSLRDTFMQLGSIESAAIHWLKWLGYKGGSESGTKQGANYL